MNDDFEMMFGVGLLCLLCIALFFAGSIHESHSNRDKLHAVGIERIDHHKTVVDGKTVTNYYEIIWKEGAKK